MEGNNNSRENSQTNANQSLSQCDNGDISMQMDDVTSDVSTQSLPKDDNDSGITLEASGICELAETNEDDASSLSSTALGSNGVVHEAVSDVDMMNDYNNTESFNDSAIPGSDSSTDRIEVGKDGGNSQNKEIESGAENVVSSAKGNGDEDGAFSIDVKLKNKEMMMDKNCDGVDSQNKLDVDSKDDMLGIDVNDAACSSSVGKLTRKGKSKRSKKLASLTTSDATTINEKNEEGEEGKTDNGDQELESAGHEKEDSLSSLTSTDDDDDEDNMNNDSSNVKAPSRYASRLFQRRRRRKVQRMTFKPNLSSSCNSSSSDDDDDDDIAIRNTDNDDEDNDVDADDDLETDSTAESEISDSDIIKITTDILNKVDPLPNWFAVPELKRREYGYTAKQNPFSFNERVQGSIQMARRLKLVESLKYHEGCVNSLCFNRIGTLLASGSDDLNVVLWNWEKGVPSLVYDSGHRGNVFQAKFMPYSGDCHVVSCARDGQVRLAELSLTGVCKSTRKLAQHRGAAHKLALEYDSANVFLSCGEDAVTYLFDLREEKPNKLMTTKEKEKKVPLYSIHSNPADSNQFCVGGRDHYIRVYDKRKIAEDVDGGVMKTLCPQHLIDNPVKAHVTCACYNHNGTEIIGSYNDEDIYLFNNLHSDGADYIHRYRGHRNNATVKGVNFYGPKSEFVVSGSDCGHLYIWEKETEAIITFLEGDNAGVINVLEPHPSLPILATSGLDHEVKLWWPTQADPSLDKVKLKKTIQTNQRERKQEAVSEPNQMSGQMLWMIMHHFRNTARRRLREEGLEMSSSDGEANDNDESDDSDAAEMNQCATS